MIVRLLLLVCSSLLCASAAAQGSTAKLSLLHDGRWLVVLTCPDTRDKSGLIKGYEYTFSAIIDAGKFEGQYGTAGKPDSVVYTGSVFEDGSLKIRGVGNTGNPIASSGKVASGTAYSYTLLGKLDGATGQAARREVRPCSATFTKQ